MRGAITLAVLLAVPQTTDAGRPLAGRDDIIYLGFAVIIVTLVGQGMTLPLLVRRLRLTEHPSVVEAEREKLRHSGLPYPKTYAYVFTNPKWFERPIPYKHPSGAVTWVRLPELDLETVRYAPSPAGSAHILLV